MSIQRGGLLRGLLTIFASNPGKKHEPFSLGAAYINVVEDPLELVNDFGLGGLQPVFRR